MKQIKKLLLSLSVLLACPVVISAQSKSEEKKLHAQMVKECVESKKYTVEPRSALTMGGRNISLLSYYSLKISNDSVYSYLPYYGRAYSLPYGGGEGLDFEAKILDYKQTVGKKGNYEIKFSARTHEDLYTFNISIYDNGVSNIHVTMQNKQSIDFIGDLLIEENKE